MSDLMVLNSTENPGKSIVFPYFKTPFLTNKEKAVLETVIEMMAPKRDNGTTLRQYHYICVAIQSTDPRMLQHDAAIREQVREYIKQMMHVNAGAGTKRYDDLDQLREDYMLFQHMTDDPNFQLENRYTTRTCWLEYLINHG